MRSALTCLGVAITVGVAQAQPLAITFRNVVSLPNTATDQNGQSFTIAGLSGICRSRTANVGLSGTFYAVMDNSNKVLVLSISVAPNGAIASAAIQSAYSISESRDFEGIVQEGSRVFLAEEGTPGVRAYDFLTGALSWVLQTPPVFAAIRPNFGFESLTGDAVEGPLWTANEEALTVDGPASTSSTGTVVRLQRFDGMGLTPGAQYAYITEPWHGTSISGARGGVSDLLLLPDGRLIALERSFAFNLAGLFQTRIYELTFTGATDVSALAGLAGQSYTPVSKRLLYQGDQQNLEGLALGSLLGSGRYALIGIVDDGDPISTNRVVGFELSGVGPPLCYANCDQSNTPPVLNANDFLCFLNAFAAGEGYANCDGSTTLPVLNANDFNCFLNRYAAGCI